MKLGRLPALLLLVTACTAGVVTSTTAAGPDPSEPTSSTSVATTVTTSAAPTTTTTISVTSTTTVATSTTVPSTTVPTTTVTTTTDAADTLAGAVIVLDPGHNGMNWAHPDEINQIVDIGTGTKACNTTGTSTVDGFPEASFTWELAQRTRGKLESLGASVTMTRADNDGWGPCITERAAIGNRAGADAVISIHADGGPTSGRGFHVIYPKVVAGLTDDIAEDSKRLAHAIHDAFLVTGMPVSDYLGSDGYTVRDDLGGLTLSDVPVVFLEAGNMRNSTDAALLIDPAFQESMADALVAGLVDYLDR
ncbi:MAG: N-acetylmuramoyl-L-alanine amidase [Acidimicrobiia bacterium]